MSKLMYRIFHLFLIVMIVLLSGCGAFRKVFKSKEYSKLETKSEARKDSVGLITDKSITTIKEKIDTTLIVPEKVVKQDTYLNMDSLVNGMTAIQNDIMDLRLVLNPVTGILSAVATIKPQSIPVLLNRETKKENDISQQSNTSEEKKDFKNQSSGSSVIQKDPLAFPWQLVFIAAGIAALVTLFFWIRRKF